MEFNTIEEGDIQKYIIHAMVKQKTGNAGGYGPFLILNRFSELSKEETGQVMWLSGRRAKYSRQKE